VTPLLAFVAAGAILAAVCFYAGAWPAGAAVALQIAVIVAASRST
jgi:hypothetical protein